MRKIIATAFVSLDGVMQGPGGPQEDTSGGFDLGGWTTNYRSEKSGAAVLDMVGTLAKPNDLLLGRKTYDNFAGFWPNAPADNPIGSVFNKANKYVLTGGSAKLEWANSHKLRNIDELKKVKAGQARISCYGAVLRAIHRFLRRTSSTASTFSSVPSYWAKAKSCSVMQATPSP
jgi:dihydrofolate reductase